VDDIGKDSRLEEIAFKSLASGNHLGTLGFCVLDMSFGFVDRCSLDEGAMRRTSVEAVANFEVRDFGSKLLGKLVIDACCCPTLTVITA
jgi:hypothetical protein